MHAWCTLSRAHAALARVHFLEMAEHMESEQEKTVLVSLKESTRVVNFCGGVAELLTAVQNCFSDILTGKEGVILQVSLLNSTLLGTS